MTDEYNAGYEAGYDSAREEMTKQGPTPEEFQAKIRQLRMLLLSREAEIERLRAALSGIYGWAVDYEDAIKRAQQALDSPVKT